MRYGSYCMDGYFGHGMTNGFTHGMNYFGYGSYLLVIAGVVLIFALLFIIFVHNKNKKNISISEAQEALKMRYVNGEISEEEYQRMKKMIQ